MLLIPAVVLQINLSNVIKNVLEISNTVSKLFKAIKDGNFKFPMHLKSLFEVQCGYFECTLYNFEKTLSILRRVLSSII